MESYELKNRITISITQQYLWLIHIQFDSNVLFKYLNNQTENKIYINDRKCFKILFLIM